jgi:IS66 C-terminal element
VRSSFSLTSYVQPPVIAAARLSDREPYAYLKDVLERMTNGHPAGRLDDLLPWNGNLVPADMRGMDAYSIAIGWPLSQAPMIADRLYNQPFSAKAERSTP